MVIMQRMKPLTLHSADKLLSEGFGRSGSFPNIRSTGSGRKMPSISTLGFSRNCIARQRPFFAIRLLVPSSHEKSVLSDNSRIRSSTLSFQTKPPDWWGKA
jgi:hypothetical protein